jgi:hypothetical protein
VKWKPVESSQIAEVGFEEPSTLGIRFKNKSGVSEFGKSTKGSEIWK